MSTKLPNYNTPKVYLSGKVTGLPLEAVEAKFAEAERLLREKGCRIINPLRLGIPSDTTWASAMGICFEALKEADVLCTLSDWQDGPGAILEVKTAKELNIPALSLSAILKYFKDFKTSLIMEKTIEKTGVISKKDFAKQLGFSSFPLLCKVLRQNKRFCETMRQRPFNSVLGGRKYARTLTEAEAQYIKETLGYFPITSR